MNVKKRSWVLAGVLGAGVLVSAVAQAGVTDRLADLLRQKIEERQQHQPQQQPSSKPSESSHARGDECLRLVDRESSSLDTSLRAMVGNPREGATKVVPILESGRSKAVGAAQVFGGADAVQSVQAVVASDVTLAGKKLQGTVLLPTSTRDLSHGYRRVPGVAIFAVLDYKPN